MSEEFLGERRSEAEQLFYDTTSKKNLSGVRGRASRTGRTGAVMTPVDFLKGKAKKEYMKNSEVILYNMYDNQIIPYDEFKTLPVEKQVALMTRWREDVGTNNIIKELRISRKKFYDEVLKNLGIETKPRGSGKRQAKKEAPVHTETGTSSITFMIVAEGRHKGRSLSAKMAGLASIIDSDREYEVTMEIRELLTPG
ncbi:MAG: hypothetical protein KGZ57_08335 [Dethiobacter sp.]|nr:hypothetical protein [Dethiobacter sp.]MCL5982824.1 hypothetical protein [Bacillota bacterium]